MKEHKGYFCLYKAQDYASFLSRGAALLAQDYVIVSLLPAQF